MAATATRATNQAAPSAHRNEVSVVGRLAAAATARVLPSGDEIVTWRLVVDRPEAARRRSGRREFDTLPCTALGARLRRQALGWAKDDVIEVTGALRSRFWRGPGGLQSRYEVEAASASRRASGLTRRRTSG